MTRNKYEILLWAILIFLLTGPFYYNLTGNDPAVEIARSAATMRGDSDGSTMPVYAVRMLVVAVAAWLTLGQLRDATFSLFRAKPIMLLMGWSILSLGWTESFITSVVAVPVLMMLIIAFYLATTRLSPLEFARAFVASSAFMAFFTLVYVFLLPHFGVHQVEDAQQSVHAGAWRGVYLHKNHLGQASAVYATAILLSGSRVIPSRLLKWSLLSLMFLLIYKSDSSSAIAIVILAPAIVWFAITLNANRKLFFSIFISTGLFIGSILLGMLLELLGRDLTFTGRTTIWGFAWDSFNQSPILGYGFMSPTYGDFTYNVSAVMGVRDPHNMYFDLALGLGIVGLIILLFAVVQSWRVGRALFVLGGDYRQAALALHGGIAAWLIAGLTESDGRPLSAVFALGSACLIATQQLPSLKRSTGLNAPNSKARSPLPRQLRLTQDM